MNYTLLKTKISTIVQRDIFAIIQDFIEVKLRELKERVHVEKIQQIMVLVLQNAICKFSQPWETALKKSMGTV